MTPSGEVSWWTVARRRQMAQRSPSNSVHRAKTSPPVRDEAAARPARPEAPTAGVLPALVAGALDPPGIHSGPGFIAIRSLRHWREWVALWS